MRCATTNGGVWRHESSHTAAGDVKGISHVVIVGHCDDEASSTPHPVQQTMDFPRAQRLLRGEHDLDASAVR